MKRLDDKVVAITGAGSGIGRALAVAFAEAGSRLALSDVDEEGLGETRTALGEVGVDAHTARVDVSEREEVEAWASEVVGAFGVVDVVVNNAGVGMTASLAETRDEDLRWIMGINFWGVVHGCNAFLPHLAARPEAHLCNVASVFSLFTYPGAGAYCASKFAVRGYTQVLAQELAGTPVEVSCVMPAGVRTQISRNARYPDSVSSEERAADHERFEKVLARTTPEKAAQVIVGGIRRGQPRIRVGPDAFVFDWLARAFPNGMQKLARLAG